jgi:NAD(P)-dependent dehydrogenase (short-subunit alcohol dehydrogenase family)
MESVKGRVALIAGAGDSISAAIALKLACDGARIALVGHDAENMRSLADQINALGAQSAIFFLKSSESGEISKAVTDVLDHYGRIDILINAFDHANSKGISEVTDEDWDSAIKDTLSSSFLYCREVIPHMRENKYGRIVNLSSFHYLGWPGAVNYSAATSGVFGLTRSLALELAKYGITINCVAKGDIITPESRLSVENVAKLTEGQPVKRLGKPEDVAYAVAFLSADSTKYVTGQTLFVCGGRSLYSSMSA